MTHGFSNRGEAEWIVAVAAHGWLARFHWPARGGTHRVVYAAVVAWTDDGAALVVDRAVGRLKRVDSDPTFVRLVTPHQVAGDRKRQSGDVDERVSTVADTLDAEDGAE